MSTTIRLEAVGDKLWQLTLEGSSTTVVDTDGQTSKTDHDSAEAASAFAEKAKAEKEKDGFKPPAEASDANNGKRKSDAADAAAPAKKAKSFWSSGPPTDKTVTPELVAEVEEKLGKKLPADYVAFLRTTQNGGPPSKSYIKGFGVDTIFGIDAEADDCLVEANESYPSEWEYPSEDYVYFASTESGGHDLVAFDYSKGSDAPTVVNIDQEFDYRVMHVAKSFTEFIANLKEDLEDAEE
eukprot:Rhum_TRINITY_DN8125_c0_g2::Rhum_TRINITY_DN8125_c0_g2_i1::g.26184::m.26184